MNNWYHDVWRGDAEAFAAGVGADAHLPINVQAGAPLDVTLAWTDAPTCCPRARRRSSTTSTSR